MVSVRGNFAYGVGGPLAAARAGSSIRGGSLIERAVQPLIIILSTLRPPMALAGPERVGNCRGTFRRSDIWLLLRPPSKDRHLASGLFGSIVSPRARPVRPQRAYPRCSVWPTGTRSPSPDGKKNVHKELLRLFQHCRPSLPAANYFVPFQKSGWFSIFPWLSPKARTSSVPSDAKVLFLQSMICRISPPMNAP